MVPVGPSGNLPRLLPLGIPGQRAAIALSLMEQEQRHDGGDDRGAKRDDLDNPIHAASVPERCDTLRVIQFVEGPRTCLSAAKVPLAASQDDRCARATADDLSNAARTRQVGCSRRRPILSDLADRKGRAKEVIVVAKASAGKPSKSALSKAGKTLASNGSSKPAKSKAGKTLGKG